MFFSGTGSPGQFQKKGCNVVVVVVVVVVVMWARVVCGAVVYAG